MNLKKGVNLGMWLAQYPQGSEEYFQNFLQKKDFEEVAGLGFDHVRVPFDFALLEEGPLNPVRSQKRGLGYLDFAVDCAKLYGLNIILDLHKAPGFSFDSLQNNNLFDRPDLQEQFLALWQLLAERYQFESDYLIFELLNEVVEPNSQRWNTLAQRTVEVIHRVHPQRPLLIGSNAYASVEELENLWLSSDPYVEYTFHFYEPLLVTHAKAHWNEFTRTYDRGVAYPGKAEGLEAFFQENPHLGSLETSGYGKPGQPQTLDRTFLQNKLTKATQFQAKSGKTPLCGEFGVYEHCEEKSGLAWIKDVVSLLGQEGIPWTWWNWKSQDFGLFTPAGKERLKGLIDILLGAS